MAACPDLDMYVDAIAAHRKAIVTVCVGTSSPGCSDEQASLARLENQLERCKAGEQVGLPDPDDTDIAVEIPEPPRRLSGSVELLGGGGHGVADDDWRGAVEPSPSLAIRAGGAYRSLGLLFSFEWTGVQLHSVPTFYPQGSTTATMERLRYLAHVQYEWWLTPDLSIDVRGGIGLETLLAGYEIALVTRNPPPGGAQHVDVDDTGLAFEAGVSFWYRCSDEIDVGVNVTIPTSQHGTKPEIIFPNTTDVEGFLGLRLSRR